MSEPDNSESDNTRSNGAELDTHSLSDEIIIQVCEAALLASANILSLEQLQGLFAEQTPPPSKAQIKQALQTLQQAYESRAVELVEVGSGWRYQVRSHLGPWVARLWQEKPPKYSRALMETLALIAYRQPITRGEIEDIRGVAVSANIMRTLLERQWIKTAGHKEVPGRPVLYVTSKGFLDYFNLSSLDQLPSLQGVPELHAQQLDSPILSTASPNGEADSSREATNLAVHALPITADAQAAHEQEEN